MFLYFEVPAILVHDVYIVFIFQNKYVIRNSMFARLGTDYEIRNQCFITVLESMTTD